MLKTFQFCNISPNLVTLHLKDMTVNGTTRPWPGFEAFHFFQLLIPNKICQWKNKIKSTGLTQINDYRTKSRLSPCSIYGMRGDRKTNCVALPTSSFEPRTSGDGTGHCANLLHCFESNFFKSWAPSLSLWAELNLKFGIFFVKSWSDFPPIFFSLLQVWVALLTSKSIILLSGVSVLAWYKKWQHWIWREENPFKDV